jgi:peptidoglycan/xylan/chitin deacetylase (PgdA/CDA1 family)
MPAERTEGLDQEWYQVSHIPMRPTGPMWPESARLALSVIISLSFFEDVPPEGAVRAMDLTGGAGLAPVRPQYALLSVREYGLRVGFFRLVRELAAAGITPAVAIDVMTAENYPFLVGYCLAQGFELIAHGIAITQPITAAMNEETERGYIAETLERFAAATGVTPRGWFGPAWSESERTPGLLKEFGIEYLCDWPNDEQPVPMSGRAEGMTSIPLMFEFDDNYAFALRNQSVVQYTDGLLRAAAQLRKEGAERPRLLAVSLSSWITGQGWRAPQIAAALGAIAAEERTIVASPNEIATWCRENRDN